MAISWWAGKDRGDDFARWEEELDAARRHWLPFVLALAVSVIAVVTAVTGTA